MNGRQGLVLAMLCMLSVSAIAETPVEKAANSSASGSNGKFTGSPITIKLKDADVHEVLRLIGDTSGFNIVIHPNVSGKITLSLEDVPWDQALEIVLSTLKLAAERNESVLRVLPKDMLIAEKQQELDSKKLVLATAPRITRIFPISYADINQMSGLLQQFANSQNQTGSSSVSSGPMTTIIVDNNTQSLIVRDTAENIEKIKKMIELLDVQTPQVLIEAKVVEASEDFSKQINGQFGIGGNSLGAGFNGQTTPLIGSQISLPGKTSFAAAGLTTFKLSGGTVGLNASLNMAESESKIKVVSSPRTVVLSGKSSSITQTRSTAVKLITPATNTSPATEQIVQISGNTKLNVTPRVTNDGSVFMKLDLSRDILRVQTDGNPAVEPRVMNTEVIVESGNTLVIGGVLNIDENSAESGIPFLRKIPLLGPLFGSEKESKAKSELMFFITPRVLNQKKTAFSDEDAAKI